MGVVHKGNGGHAVMAKAFRHRSEAARRQSNKLANLGPNTLDLDDPQRQEYGHALLPEVQDMDIITFANKILGVSFEARPAQELVLRLMYGLPIPEGIVEVYVEKPSVDGALVLERQRMTWMELYTLITGNTEVFEPLTEKDEGVFRVGRRGGKSFMTSIIIDYESTREHWRRYLNRDEIGWAIITATRQSQAENILLDTCHNLFMNSKLRFKYIVDDKTRDKVVLKNGYRIAAYPCSSNAGLGLAAFIHAFDELAYYGVTGPKSDEKVVDALTPAQSQFSAHHPKTLMISTPAGKQGLFYKTCDEGTRVPGRLTVCAPSWVFNPPNAYGDPEYRYLRRKHKQNPEGFDMWFRANFAEILEALIRPEDVDAVSVLSGELPYKSGKFYCWGADQSGLTGNDKFAFAIGHKEVDRGVIVTDLVRSWSTRDGDAIIAELKGLCRRYHLGQGFIDRYAKGWVIQAMQKAGLLPEVGPPAVEVWLNLKSIVVAEKIELPQRTPLTDAIKRTQGFYTKANNMSIVHERDDEGHGDEADALARMVMALSRAGWIPSHHLSGEEEAQAAAQARAEEEYDPLTYALN